MKDKSKKVKSISVRISTDLHKAIKKHCVECDVSFQELINGLVQNELLKHVKSCP